MTDADRTVPPSLEAFQAALDSEVEVSALEGGEGTLALRLVEATRRRCPPGWSQYSVLFRGPSEPVQPQGIYRFRHPAFGERDLLMVPVGRTPAGAEYEVCVSRREPGAADA